MPSSSSSLSQSPSPSPLALPSIDLASTAWWLKPPLLTDANGGLSAQQAAAMRQRYGENRFIEHREPPIWRQYLAHFNNPLVVILLLASVVSAMLGELINFFIITIIILASVTLDFFQEHRARTAAEKLRQSIALRARVVRDGIAQSIAVRDIVPGDIVLLKAGDLVPADGVLVAARDCFVNQSVLTGESYPVEKRAVPINHGDDLQAATNALFMGSSVVSGSATLCVVQTGSATAMGAIAERITVADDLSPFDQGTRQFNAMILRLTIGMVLFVLLVNLLSHKPWLSSFLFALALAVGLTPELLPMVVSVTLARGSIRMAREQVIIKRQRAIQDLGSMDVLCTDKTGTLTEAKIHMQSHLDPLGGESEQVLVLAYLNSWFETGLRNPMDEAILTYKKIDISGWKKIDEVPFDFERRRVSVLLEKAGERLLIVKGAPDELLRLCTQYMLGDQVCEITSADRDHIRDVYRSQETEGFRVLAIAYKPVAVDHPHAVVDDESALVLAGFTAFLDPPRESAKPALKTLLAAGVDVKIVTGDSERVTQHICQVLELPVQGIVLGSEIERLDQSALRARVASANIFCRLNPSQKERVITALRACGHVVGYLGDGVNDAPALHSADVGISVDGAVDVAKAAADVILLKHDLNVLVRAVMEGRRTFGNIMKYILMGSSSNFGNMFSMAGASVFLPFLPMLPTQILLNNILYDLSEIAIPLDEVDDDELRQPHVLDIQLIQRFMWIIGPISSAFDFLTFGLLLWLFKANEALFQTGWFVESMCTQVLVIFIIRTRGNPLKSTPHPLLALTSLLVVTLAIFLPFTIAGTYFG
ncbi:MAG: magnesium-translocating P-type ATPase, partial [Burkholderiaceae bacterium]